MIPCDCLIKDYFKNKDPKPLRLIIPSTTARSIFDSDLKLCGNPNLPIAILLLLFHPQLYLFLSMPCSQYLKAYTGKLPGNIEF